ncbi:DUF4113 domain-containing protein [Propionibacterium acidifaciens]
MVPGQGRRRASGRRRPLVQLRAPRVPVPPAHGAPAHPVPRSGGPLDRRGLRPGAGGQPGRPGRGGPADPRGRRIGALLDEVNGQLGRGALGLGLAGMAAPPDRRMRRGMLSNRATTRWDEPTRVRA